MRCDRLRAGRYFGAGRFGRAVQRVFVPFPRYPQEEFFQVLPMMSSIAGKPLAAPVRGAGFGIPVRNLGLSLILTGLLFGGAGWAWGRSGYDILLIGIGWPHILLGFFSYGLKLRRGQTSRLIFPAGLALWAAIAWLHHEFLLLTFIQMLFVFHAVRDEISIYLRTRAGEDGTPAVSELPGMMPFLAALLLVPNWSVADDAARYDLRGSTRVAEVPALEASEPGWTLFPFAPVEGSEGRSFRFWIEARGSAPFPEMVAALAPSSTRFLVNGRPSRQTTYGSPLALGMVPRFGSELQPPEEPPPADRSTARVNGGHRLGQRFVAEREELSGVWLWIEDAPSRHQALDLRYGLEPAPLVPASVPFRELRFGLIVLLGVLGIRQIARSPRPKIGAWAFLAAMTLLFALPVVLLTWRSGPASHWPYLFQFLVVFHYVSWYVFALRRGAVPTRRTFRWVASVLLLNAVLVGAARLCQTGELPAVFGALFRIEYFVYALLFHVCLSFGHRRANGGSRSPWGLLD